MSLFYIGQRVRKVGGYWNIGHTATVSGYDDRDPLGMGLCVRMDEPAVGMQDKKLIDVPAGTDVWARPEDFEPILPEGLESPADIAALYEPEGMHA